MNPLDEAKTITERYISAGNSANLTLDADNISDADVLIAAGWSPGMLGHAALRLHGEFDSFSRSQNIGATEAILALGHLNSLRSVAEPLKAWAAKRGMSDVEHLVQAVLSHWLEPRCRPCEGRGFEKVRGTPMLGRTCKACGGSGESKPPRGREGHAMLALIDDCVNISRASMKARLWCFRDMGHSKHLKIFW